MPSSTPPPIVLAFAGTDPTGGAGIQADLLTLASMGCHALSVVTAVTVQDTAGVEGVMAMDSDWVVDQARLVLEDMPVVAFKVGMVGSVENIAAIAEIVADYPDIPLILDPVLASGRGDELASDDMQRALCELLLPQTTIITPNCQEARRLARAQALIEAGDAGDGDQGDEVGDDSDRDTGGDPDLAECARRILSMGCEYVLITGTHENTPQVINTLYNEAGVVRADTWERLPGSYHGSGCTLASAIAATLANGLDIPEAVREAQEYTWQSLAAGFRPGMGQLLPDRFFWAREINDGRDDAAPGDLDGDEDGENR
ncbi:MAG: hydroxymethylpyrimidine/phosphomethylpyrimidine kinase [Betaproteobacteria bacterium]|nr:hydroxymethylpyrimidine/phosphomethylpyrimidine kinase [Betaproteobacteria bacterium]